MTTLEFEDLSFEELEDKVTVNFIQNYYFHLDKNELEKIGPYRLGKNTITFDVPEKRAHRKFNMLISIGMQNLKNKLTGRKTIYITEESGIPLIGNNSFGIVDRNSSLIEIKPCTGCNLNCIYCSVDEGKSGKWLVDLVIEPNYIIQELKKIVEFKGVKVEAHIGTQGEPFLYPKIIELIKGLASIKEITTISLDTNGTLLSKSMIDKLAEAGLTRINLSLNSLEPELAKYIAGTPYNLDHVLEIARYTAKKLELLIAPVWIPGINDKEIPKLIEFSKELKARIGIQNFLNYKYGRNPVKATDWDDFKAKLKGFEKKYDVKLLLTEEDFSIKPTKKLPKPFKKGQVITANIVSEGRLKNEKIASAGNRNITVPNCRKTGIIKVKLTRDKHNVFFGRCL